MTSKVSVILPSYNHHDFLMERLDSIFNQSYQNYEVIIIDDCSTDSSMDILIKYKNHPKVKYFIVNDVNSGSGYKSWFKGINLAESKYIWIAETDDVNDLDFLSETVKILDQNEDLALVFTASNYIDKEGRFLYNTDNRMKTLKVEEGEYGIFGDEIFLTKLPLSPYITNASAVLFRNPGNVPVEIFSFKQMSDLFLWRYLVENKKIAFLNRKLNGFRRHESSTTSLNYSKNRILLYEEYVDFVNYFKCNSTITKQVLKEYVFSFVGTKWNTKGFLYLGPMRKIHNFNTVQLWLAYFKFMLLFVIHKLKKL